jgi:integrase
MIRVAAATGLRVGELTHLLIEDVDLKQNIIHVRSKPVMFWHVKTSRERLLPAFPEIRPIFAQLIGERKAGFIFLNRDSVKGRSWPAAAFTTPRVMREHLAQVVAKRRSEDGASEQDVRRAVTAFLRGLGQIPEKRIRQEFMKLTKKIGHPELTKAHSMRHLFATRAQEAGMNPFLVQSLLGHASLDMTGRYTHVSMDAKREAMREMFRAVKVAGTDAGE